VRLEARISELIEAVSGRDARIAELEKLLSVEYT